MHSHKTIHASTRKYKHKTSTISVLSVREFLGTVDEVLIDEASVKETKCKMLSNGKHKLLHCRIGVNFIYIHVSPDY